MKYIILSLFLLLIVFSFAQTDQKFRNQKISLNISNYKTEIKNEKELTFNLVIRNISNEDIQIPIKYSIIPNDDVAGSVCYEVYYCDTMDTLNFTQLILEFHDHFGFISSQENDFKLKRGSSYSIQSSLESIYFWKKGTYKVRFVLKKNFFRGLISDDVYSNWVILTVKNDIWLPSKNGLSPAMRY